MSRIQPFNQCPQAIKSSKKSFKFPAGEHQTIFINAKYINNPTFQDDKVNLL